MLKHRANLIVAVGIVWTVVSALCFGTSASAGEGLIVGPQRTVLLPGHTHVIQLVGNPGSKRVCATFVPNPRVTADPLALCIPAYSQRDIRLTVAPGPESSVVAEWQVRVPDVVSGSGLNVIARVGSTIVTDPTQYIAEHPNAIPHTTANKIHFPWWILLLIFIAVAVATWLSRHPVKKPRRPKKGRAKPQAWQRV